MLYTKEEIRNFILSTLKSDNFKGTCRVSSINSKCNDETVFLKTLEEMEDNGEIRVEMPFIILGNA